ncbi:MAG: hypothetical protein QOI00_1364 [Chloroflexota bacterium]|jgi:hypothetical protein|nr:hypothetical protein [Chloroflexota bacterium]
MHNYPFFAILAIDLARERAAEADAYRFAALATAHAARPSRLRRGVARAALAVARAADGEAGRVPAASH